MSLEREEPQHFGAGPALMPTPVLQQAAKDLINFNDIGLGIGEISHRSKDATKVIEDSKKHLIELLNIPDTHEVFYLQGGGTTGFSSVATNLAAAYVGKHGKIAPAGYLVTGSWSQKSFEEAKRLHVPAEVIFNAKDYNNGKFGKIPDESLWEDKIKGKAFSYVYLCENETVHGVEWPELPKCLVNDPNIEIVADLSSDILSRKIDVSQYGVIMAGAQKNIGLAGLTLYIIKKSILKNISGASDETLHELGVPITPIAFDYPTVVKNNSAYNTIPIFTLHVMDLVFQHILKKGGVEAQQAENEEKAKILYEALDANSDFYNVPVDPKCRSKMNVVFTLKKDGLDDQFLKEAAARHLTGLKGHRSVGGFRASIYNALSVKTVQNLVDFIKEFAEKNA
ncbi:ADI_G0057140.mRNA.1.CDS.1 [Saccharomyces cerevisiae]|uniref:Phosphoserine aminotransferase n=1 Tax=Saccharomyces cerevisiae (strain Lalvin EC1118 / Prise de mousse) TaxID=643680 RepID=C8ZGU3_YEAS8|nr:Ser1p [Saccharomyces cerevisiae YJM993]AJT71124.1 Ser1p [Saccharomyces cerevisiae YJM189]AJT72577.1 Ser1p [Saccharomyces cerevisiae YJM244]AJT75513.1 Ser1p [Saccharomyces cerevisiae YJM428]AJT76499.1 Ser1p [Saccharomyces cerevisiae YJM451]AJT76994.1 Ser1p [Saccharomyces cerevisiae YJM453]AJT77485.1 Ser1p [Saccharomyces cerevisiae YJM456]AJT79937.1 Ser1p [Saccharomyces cerevisiae YJM627]AJT82390.1 Ser1p [Saccharomyces cerevisiae YJM693]AJT82882.1 Ser1p [Saccharomyces cerevisiae YJM969]A